MSATVPQTETKSVETDDQEGAIHTDVMNSAGYYGRPQYKVSYYSQKINAGAMATFETRAEAVGFVAIGQREGWMERPSIGYRESYDFTPSKHYK